ncbi:unnamed protein product, partial [Coregonus sp. 'balchen']
MGAVQTEIALCSRPWRGPFHIYVGLACNSLTAALTPLHDAAYHGRLLILRTLVTQGFHVDMLTMDMGLSPPPGLSRRPLRLHQVKMVSTDGATPLFNACSSGSVACYSFTTHLVHHLSSPIHEAAKRGHRECLEGSHGAHIDLELPGVGTPLYTACLAQATDCVERPLQSGVDDQGGCGQDTSLHAAVQGGGVREHPKRVCERREDFLRWWPAVKKPPHESEASDIGPCTLSQLCRFCIRKSLGRTRLHRTSGLYLPYRFQAFLL